MYNKFFVHVSSFIVFNVYMYYNRQFMIALHRMENLIFDYFTILNIFQIIIYKNFILKQRNNFFVDHLELEPHADTCILSLKTLTTPLTQSLFVS